MESNINIKNEQHQSNTELEQLQELFVAFGFENYDLVSESDAGYIFQDTTKIDPDTDTILFDLDDTIIPYTESKEERLNQFHNYLASNDLELDTDSCSTLMDSADRFSRWVEDSGAERYHQPAHASALAWAVGELKSGKDISDVTTMLESYDVLSGSDQIPFSLTESPEEIVEVFNTMAKINPYVDVIETIHRLGGSTSELESPLAVGVLTYGEPDFQLKKVLYVLQLAKEAGRELPISQIMLTKVQKGMFLKDVIESQNSLKVYTLVDDSPEELDSRHLATTTGPARLAPIRLRKLKTKNFAKDWGMDGHASFKNNGTGIYHEGGDSDLFKEILRVTVNTRSRLAETNTRIMGSEEIESHNERVRAYGKALLNSSSTTPSFTQTLFKTEDQHEEDKVA